MKMMRDKRNRFVVFAVTAGLLAAIMGWFATSANGQGSSFYDSWAGQVGSGPDSAWGIENTTDPNNGNVYYTNTTPSQSSRIEPDDASGHQRSDLSHWPGAANDDRPGQ